MLATCGEYVLLGRNRRWAAGRYSLLAGFAELGETLEEAASREIAEESGVTVPPQRMRYRASQPWPFPSSLMVGFEGEAVGVPEPARPFETRPSQSSRAHREAAALGRAFVLPGACRSVHRLPTYLPRALRGLPHRARALAP